MRRRAVQKLTRQSYLVIHPDLPHCGVVRYLLEHSLVFIHSLEMGGFTLSEVEKSIFADVLTSTKICPLGG